MPSIANAGFFDSLATNEASAQSTTPLSDKDKTNSQTIGLLEANVSPFSIIEEKKEEKKTTKTKNSDSEVKEDAEVNIVSENALLPTTGLLGVADDEEFEDFSSDPVDFYVVRKGETIAQIADLFNITPDTILSLNGLKKGDKISEGDVLLILSFSAIEHPVKKGETLQSIAKKYGVDIEEIIYHNVDINEKTKLAVGDKILVPGASIPSEVVKKVVPKNNNASITQDNSNYDTKGYFINPAPGSRKGRGTSFVKGRRPHAGVDMGGYTGMPIYAAATGTVIIARGGWNGGYGNYIVIQHDNGLKTVYAHLSQIKSKVGERKQQGELIGIMGSTGRSTGPHLHFEVKGGKNPGNTWSWKPWNY